MPLQQVGQAATASGVPVFYVPLANQPPNAFAAFTHGFLQQRSPAALELFRRRLAALDPSARAAALNEAAQIQADLERARTAAITASRQSDISLAKALIDSATRVQGFETEASIARQRSATELAGRATTLQSDQAKGVAEAASTVVRDMGDAVRSGNANDLDRAKATLNSLLRDAQGSLDGFELSALSRVIRSQINNAIPRGAGREQLVADIELPSELDVEVPPAGARGFGALLDQVQQAAGGLGIDLAAPGQSLGVRATVPVGDASRPDGPPTSTPRADGTELLGSDGSEPQAVTADPETLLRSLVRPPRSATPTGSDTALERQQGLINEAFNRGETALGGIGDPLFRREDPRTETLMEFIRTAPPSAQVDFRAGAQAAGERRGPFPAARLQRGARRERERDEALTEETRQAAGATVSPGAGGAESEEESELRDLVRLPTGRQVRRGFRQLETPEGFLGDIEALAGEAPEQESVDAEGVPEEEEDEEARRRRRLRSLVR